MCYDELIQTYPLYEAYGWFDLEFACNCIGMEECTVNFDSENWKLNPECDAELDSRFPGSIFNLSPTLAEIDAQNTSPKPEPNLMMTVICMENMIANPITGETVTKEQMGMTIVFIDMLVIVCFILFSILVERAQK